MQGEDDVWLPRVMFFRPGTLVFEGSEVAFSAQCHRGVQQAPKNAEKTGLT